MNFGQALNELEKGKRVTRYKWKGNEEFLYLVSGSRVDKVNLKIDAYNALKDVSFTADTITFNSHIDKRTEDGTIIIGWTPSQKDMFANDWMLFED